MYRTPNLTLKESILYVLVLIFMIMSIIPKQQPLSNMSDCILNPFHSSSNLSCWSHPNGSALNDLMQLQRQWSVYVFFCQPRTYNASNIPGYEIDQSIGRLIKNSMSWLGYEIFASPPHPLGNAAVCEKKRKQFMYYQLQ